MTSDLEQKIRERAYQIWESEGRIDGRADEHWHRAIAEVTATAGNGVVPVSEVSVFASEAEITMASKPKGRRKSVPAAAAVEAVNATPRRRRATKNALPH